MVYFSAIALIIVYYCHRNMIAIIFMKNLFKFVYIQKMDEPSYK